jgi:D-alanyl-D-alanine carboxypeptidase (penicillin-binding protein 5/6)
LFYKHTNKLVRFYNGVDGLKTGYTDEAGYCLTATALRNDMRLIAVVFGEPDSKVRNGEISKMLDYGFNVYETEKLLSNNSVIGEIEVIKGKDKYVEIVPKYDVDFLYKKGEEKKNIVYDIKINKYQAPLIKGEVIGNLDLIENNKVIRSVEISIKKDVKKANILELYLRYLLDIIKGDINIKVFK